MTTLSVTPPTVVSDEAAGRALTRGTAFVVGAAGLVVAALGVAWTGVSLAPEGPERALAIDGIFDVAVAIFASALMLAVLLVGSAASDRSSATGLTWITAIGAGTLAVVSALRAGGSIPESAQLSVAGLFLVLLIAWLAAIGRAGRRTGVFGRGLSRFASILALGLALALMLLVFGAVFPEDTRGRAVVFTLGAIPGVLAWVALPIWWVVAAFRMFPSQRR